MTLLEISSGDTAWVLASAALVLLMTPGLAMFYGGMVRANSTLNMIMMSFVTMGTDRRSSGPCTATGWPSGTRLAVLASSATRSL
jgi:hypothetical protein